MRILLLALPLLMLAPDTGGGSGTVIGFTKEKPPLDGDFTPAAVQFREGHPELYADKDKAKPKPKPEDEEAKEEKPEVGTDGHPPHEVFSESNHPKIPEGEPDMKPAPTNFE